VYDTRHLGGNGSERLAPEIGIVAILCDVALEFVTEAILLLPYRNLAGDPERAAQAGITVLRQSGLAPILTGLLCREIKPAELQKLAMMAEPPEITPFRKDRQRDDGADAGDAAQNLIVSAIAEQVIGHAFDLIPLTDQASGFGDDHSEHADGWRISWQR